MRARPMLASAVRVRTHCVRRPVAYGRCAASLMPPAGITPLVEAIYAGRGCAELLNDGSVDELDTVRNTPPESYTSRTFYSTRGAPHLRVIIMYGHVRQGRTVGRAYPGVVRRAAGAH